MDKKEYRKYLKSGKWRQKRQRKFEEVGARCEECGSLRNLQIHHVTYVRVGDELLSDLKVLCSSCHREAHGINAIDVSSEPKHCKTVLNGIIMSIKNKIDPKTCNEYIAIVDKVIEERLKYKLLTNIKKNGRISLTKKKRVLNENQINSLHYIKSNQQYVINIVNRILVQNKK